MSGAAPDGREETARRLVSRTLPGATVNTAGHLREVAVISGCPDAWRRVSGPERREVVRALKTLGYRYVGLDLVSTPEGGE